MGIQHIISIDREARLSIDTGRLKIVFFDTKQEHFIAAIDIAVLILAHPCITLSIAVQYELAKNGAVIITVGEKYIPRAISLPIGINLDGAKRAFLQAKFLGKEENGNWWKQIVVSKILGQAKICEYFDRDLANRLKYISKNVETYDKTMRESQAAGAYWPIFLKSVDSKVLCREKQGACDPINISLNYGYSILRSMVARSLASAGLCLTLGVGHHSKDNPFNLADDFIEPFRYIIDAIVWNIFSQNHSRNFDKELKKELLQQILSSTINILGREYRIFNGIDCVVQGFCLSLEDPRRKLPLPNIPIRPGKAPSSKLWSCLQIQDEI